MSLEVTSQSIPPVASAQHTRNRPTRTQTRSNVAARFRVKTSLVPASSSPTRRWVVPPVKPSSVTKPDGSALVVKKNLSVAAGVEHYLAHLRRRGAAENTIRTYGHFLNAFADWTGARAAGAVTPAEVDLLFLGKWCNEFAERHGRAPASTTFRAAIQALHSFYAFLDAHDELRDDDGNRARNPMSAIDPPKLRKRPNDYLNGDEAAALLAAAVSPQDRIVTMLLRWTGLRNGEAVTLLASDLDHELRTLRIRRSKTDAGLRTIPIVPALAAELDRWIAYASVWQPWTPGTPVLVTRRGTAMKREYVLQTVKRVAQRAGVRLDLASGKSSVTAHCLRRTFATDLLNRGVRLEVVAKLLGHADTRVTATYYAELLPETTRVEMFDALGITPETASFALM
jgi:site-specific recombinase XerD